MAHLSKPLRTMKRIIILLLALMPVIACVQQKPKEKVIINGDRSIYATLDSTLYLATKDTTEFGVKVYEAKDGLMLESNRALADNLFGIKSNTGYSDRLKYEFTFVDIIQDKYIYKIPYNEMPSFFGVYYIQNLDYCWIFYQYDDFSNDPNMVEFSPAEFASFFRRTRAHIMNY